MCRDAEVVEQEVMLQNMIMCAHILHVNLQDYINGELKCGHRTLCLIQGDDETLSCTAQDSRVTVQRGYNPTLHNDRQYTVSRDKFYPESADAAVILGSGLEFIKRQACYL